MKKTLTLFFSLFVTCFFAIGAPIDSIKALEIAVDFYSQIVKAPLRVAAKESFSKSQLSSFNNDNFYIYNISDNSGFVIVASDDIVSPILGYSTENGISEDNLPPAFTAWMENYSEYISYIKEKSDASSVSINGNEPLTVNYSLSNNGSSPLTGNHSLSDKETNSLTANYSVSLDESQSLITKSLFSDQVDPLLGNIEWNQSYPYNMYIDKNYPTGCVATAGAQIMKYYQYPSSGVGQKNGIDFSSVVYDWSSMTDTYSNSSTLQSCMAVGTLMKHIGAAVNMKYASGGSAAVDYDLAKALRDNFSYDKNIQELQRNYYSLDIWKSILRNELDNERPVVYSGHSNSDGHTFVCDGYDNNDKFHINWGWSGYCNGYFVLTELVPTGDLGLGAGSGTYNLNQRMIIGICPPNENSRPIYEITLDNAPTFSKTTVSKNEAFAATFPKITNWGIIAYKDILGIGIYKDNVLVASLGEKTISINGQIIYTNIPLNLTLPDNIEDGSYEIYPYYVEKGEKVRLKALSSNNFSYELKVDGNSATISDNKPKADVILTSMIENTELIQGKDATFTLNVENKGNADYNSTVGIFLFGQDGATSDWFNYIFNTEIKAGEKKQLTFTANVKHGVGKYIVSARYDPNNIKASELFAMKPDEFAEKVVYVTLTSGIDENKNDEFLILPLENYGGFTIKSPNEINSVSIWDVKGNLIFNESNKNFKDDTYQAVFNGAPNNLYIIKVTTPEGNRVFKSVLQ
ncbi:MAG: C10 family peptidase [Bacteroidales bacterium]|nr:C10 family peptidase [Bacteroidales bacterium]